MSVITIGGQLGSGAPEVGKIVAERLHVDYIDREIIAEVAAKLQRKEIEVIAKEMPPSTLLGRVAEALGRSHGLGDAFAGAYLPVWEIPLNDRRYFQALESVVTELARRQSLVIRGRGSQFILKDHPGALHVLMMAPVGLRTKRVMEGLNIDQEAAKAEIAHFDGAVQEFVKRYFKAAMEDPLHYDLVINTGHLDFQAAATVVVDALPFLSK
jgi:cytidylate kinase